MEQIFAFLGMNWYWILIGLAVLIILVKFLPRYKIAPPDKALIISGLIRRNYKVRDADGSVSTKKFGYRIIRGGATFYVPAVERIDSLDTGPHGYILGETFDRYVDVKFIPRAKREYRKIVLQCTADDTSWSLKDRLEWR